MKYLLTLIFGQKAQGEKVTQPSLRTIEPDQRPEESEWTSIYAVGSRYGYRGSFYQQPDHVKVLNKITVELA